LICKNCPFCRQASNAKSKSAANSTATAKQRTKSTAKSKKAAVTAAAVEGTSTTATGRATPPLKATKGAAGRKTVRSASGSRSASVVPGGTPAGDADVDKPEKQEEEEEADNEDDKLYCLCKTKYDEGRVMIACDRYVILALQFCFQALILFCV